MSALNQSGWKPTSPTAEASDGATVTGNRALMLEEPLLFEIGRRDQTGVDLTDAPSVTASSPAGTAAPQPTPAWTLPRPGWRRWSGCSSKSRSRRQWPAWCRSCMCGRASTRSQAPPP